MLWRGTVIGIVWVCAGACRGEGGRPKMHYTIASWKMEVI